MNFCTVARWDNGEVVEENLFYDVVGLMRLIGIGEYAAGKVVITM